MTTVRRMDQSTNAQMRAWYRMSKALYEVQLFACPLLRQVQARRLAKLLTQAGL